jgi:hypothetical protein
MTRKPTRYCLSKMALGSLLLATSASANEPNPKSVAEVQACLEDSSTALVCSSKELSNVTLQCQTEEGSFFYKIDDLEEVLIEDLYSASFECPNGASVIAVFVKSGSARSGVAPGAGDAVFGPSACPVECPAPVDGDEGDGGDGENETPDEETPR